MALMKWDPFETLSTLQQDIDGLFNRRLTPNQPRATQTADWLPAVDIHEDKEGYHFDLEAPGLDKESFEVKIEDHALAIKGEKKKDAEKKEKNYYRLEREYGTFFRSFLLPDNADAEKVSAEYKDGVLHVNVAKLAAAQPKRIEVRVNH
jgi:HSP20 family protein